MVSKLNEIKISYKNFTFSLNAKTAEPLVQWLESSTDEEITKFIKKFRILNSKSYVPKCEKIINIGEFEIECPTCECDYIYKTESFYHFHNSPYIDCKNCAMDIELDDNECPKRIESFCKKCNTHLHYFEHEVTCCGTIECYNCGSNIKISKT